MKKAIGILAAVLLIFVALNGLLLYKLNAAEDGKTFLKTQVFVTVTPALHDISFWIDEECTQPFASGPLYYVSVHQGETGSFDFFLRNDSLVPVSVNTSLTPVDWAYVYMTPGTQITIQPGAIDKVTLSVSVKLETPIGNKEPFILEFYE